MIPENSPQRLAFLDGVSAELLLLTALMIFMVSDIVMGVMVAKNGLKVNSAASFRGMCKKVAVLMLIMLASVLEGVLGLLFKPSYPLLFNEVITVFFLGWEGLSITENMAMLGVPIPDAWRAALSKLREIDKQSAAQLVKLDTSGGPLDVKQSSAMTVKTDGEPLKVTQTDAVPVVAAEPLPVVPVTREGEDAQSTKGPDPPAFLTNGGATNSAYAS